MLPTWVHSARKLPIAFAQVREDPLLDLAVLEKLPPDARVLMIASGGCTAAYLTASGRVRSLELVDPNPAQLALSQLKLHLLSIENSRTRMEVLGHLTLSAVQRNNYLREAFLACRLQPDVLGDLDVVAEFGPDQAGRYERIFAALQEALRPLQAEMRRVLTMGDPLEQREAFHSEAPLGVKLDEALDETMSLPILVHLFGEEATRNPVQSFSRHFARRIRHVLSTLPARNNAYLWQMLLGAYPDEAPTPWLALPRQHALPAVHYTQAFMTDALKQSREPQDFVHLSNILDWLSPDVARETLELAWNALRPGGMTLIRQLNSSLDIRALAPQFEWLDAESRKLHARDRSFFYRALHWGRRRQ